MAYVRYRNRDERNQRILELASAGMSLRRIASEVGCSYSTAHEVVNPKAKARYNARRAAYMARQAARPRRIGES